MSTKQEYQFGDLNYNYNQVKVGDKDAQSDVILNVYYTTEKMIIYRTKGNLVVTFSNHANRFSVLNAKMQEINNLLQYKFKQGLNHQKELETLRAFYSPQLAHAYQMCYLEKYEEAFLIADNVKRNIEERIISKAQYTYFNYYLKYLAFIFMILFVFLIVNNATLLCQKTPIPNWFLLHFYIAIAGVIGSFISAKEKVANRKIDFTMPEKRTILDVKLRILFGGIFGILTVWLIYAKVLLGFIETQIDKNLFANVESIEFSQIIIVLLIGVVGGFSERLVPDTLQAKLKDIKSEQNKEETTQKVAVAIEKAKKSEAKNKS